MAIWSAAAAAATETVAVLGTTEQMETGEENTKSTFAFLIILSRPFNHDEDDDDVGERMFPRA